jgi:hypothetical protein
MTAAQFAAGQLAPVQRLPHPWSHGGKISDLRQPVLAGHWWSVSEGAWAGMSEEEKRRMSHVGRIMETELGVQLTGGERCGPCQANEHECWVYSAKGLQQISKPGSTCARCRATIHAGGCKGVSKRSPAKPRGPPPSPGPRHLGSKGPGQGPPPGAGGSGIAV